MDIANKVFLVTGGASGLGAATARKAVAVGGRVVLADRDVPAGEALAAELGASATFASTDVTDEASAANAVAAALSAFGALHVLVNCAGVAPARKVVGKDGPHSLEAFRQVIDINLTGSFNMIRLAAATMMNNPPDQDGERGVIVNTASVAAFDGQVGQAAYAASKGGIVAMTMPLARELAKHGIRVMAVAPGVMETSMLQGMPEEVQAGLAQSVPFPQRLGKPAEFAALVRHICENRYLNGEVIRLDGALRMAGK